MEKEIRVTVFEDNYLLRDGYTQLINDMPGIVCADSFENANDVITKIKKSNPDVVLMDIDMPGINGIEATKIIKQNFPDIQIIIQTVFEDDDKIFESILAGANGYVLKKSPPTKIIDAISEVMHGGAPLTPTIAAKALQLFRVPHNPFYTKQSQQLNERQNEILQCIVNGMSYKLIADKLFISVDTVRYHVKNIYAILHVNSRYDLMKKK
jgi:DNA-binding NarL/FixJ family response regulator